MPPIGGPGSPENYRVELAGRPEYLPEMHSDEKHHTHTHTHTHVHMICPKFQTEGLKSQNHCLCSLQKVLSKFKIAQGLGALFQVEFPRSGRESLNPRVLHHPVTLGSP